MARPARAPLPVQIRAGAAKTKTASMLIVERLTTLADCIINGIGMAA